MTSLALIGAGLVQYWKWRAVIISWALKTDKNKQMTFKIILLLYNTENKAHYRAF